MLFLKLVMATKGMGRLNLMFMFMFINVNVTFFFIQKLLLARI